MEINERIDKYLITEEKNEEKIVKRMLKKRYGYNLTGSTRKETVTLFFKEDIESHTFAEKVKKELSKFYGTHISQVEVDGNMITVTMEWQ